MIKVGIIGATGYAGVELVRLLSTHKDAEIVAISSVSFEGQKLSEIYPAFNYLNDFVCENQEEVVLKSDVVFAALPHGLSQELAIKCYNSDKLFIDLGADFRLEKEEEYIEWYKGTFLDKDIQNEAVYALPELFRKNIRGKKVIANPGCYSTAVPLALAPAITNGIISSKNIIADCKSGATGAGRSLTQTTHFTDLNEGFSAYKVAQHRHTPEIEQTIHNLGYKDATITFTPHLLPVNRGILATCYANLSKDVSIEEIREMYLTFYKDEYFVRVLDDGKFANIKNVRCSNFCDISIHLDKRTDRLIVISAIDNMVKGAAGQAIQNMNIICGLDEKTGLEIIPPSF